MHWLEEVRNKPHEEKVRIIKTILTVCGLLLVLAWITFEKVSGRDGFLGESLIDRVKQNIR